MKPKTESGGGVPGSGQRAPFPAIRELGEHCKLPPSAINWNLDFGSIESVKNASGGRK